MVRAMLLSGSARRQAIALRTRRPAQPPLSAPWRVAIAQSAPKRRPAAFALSKKLVYV